MYSSRGGNNGYGQQQPYASLSGYSKNLGSANSVSSAGGPGGSSMASRHLSMLGRGPPESDRYSSRGAHYCDQYSSVYESTALSSCQQPDMYERMNQALLLRQEQMLKAQSLQSSSLDGGSRQADYLAARGASIRHSAQYLMSYGGRLDADPLGLSMLSASSYGGQHASSILGAAPRRNVDDYAPTSSSPGYGVSLPPGRDYATGKGLQDASLDLDYPCSSHSRIDEQKDDTGGYARELERKEERRREHLREREKDREREKERERDRERKLEREQKRDRMLERREKERDREREIRRERWAERHGYSLTKDVKPPQRDSPRREILHRRHSPVKEKRREYDCKVKKLYKSLVTE